MARNSKSEPVQRVEEIDFDPARLRAITEAMFSQLGNTRLSAAVDRAQEVMFDAWECEDAADRVELAIKALKISKNCADAWNLLGDETARSLDDALDLYGKAVAAGERALGKAAFVEDVGMFWGLAINIISRQPGWGSRGGEAMCKLSPEFRLGEAPPRPRRRQILDRRHRRQCVPVAGL